MKALDTNVLVRLLVNDDKVQARRAKAVLERAEQESERYYLTLLVVLELIWVLSAVYQLTRGEVLDALEFLTQMPVLELESSGAVLDLVRVGRSGTLDLPDLLIGLGAKAQGCETTLTFEKGLESTGFFERI
ncbi:MAG: PIN domain-containing protein [Vicinamibacteria bacterium]